MLEKQHLIAGVKCNLSNACAASTTISDLFSHAPENSMAHALEQPLTYPDTKGNLELRQAISQFHGKTNPEHYMTFCGAQEAIWATMAATLSPGDEVIACTPAYPPLIKTLYGFGATLKPIPLHEADQWNIDLDLLENTISPKTKLIIMNQPHNPTGSILSQDEIQRLQSLVENTNRYLIADEVSLHSLIDHQPINSIYAPDPNIIGIGVCSKSLGLSGLRIGWAIVSNETLLEQMLTIKTHLSICTSQIDEWILRCALEKSNAIIERNNRILNINLHAFTGICDRRPDALRWVKQKAGLLSLVKLKQVSDIQPFAIDLLRDTGIMILPAQYLGLDGAYFRLGLGPLDQLHHLPTFEHYIKGYG